MIELLQEYWRPFLYSDGVNITGLAMTLWLLSASLLIGFVVSIPLSIARVSPKFYVRWPVQFYTYLFRGTPLYIQLLICYTGIYSIAAVRAQPMLDSFFRDAMNCTILAFALNTCAYTTEIFAGAIRSMNHGEVEAAKAYGLTGWKLYAYVIVAHRASYWQGQRPRGYETTGGNGACEPLFQKSPTTHCENVDPAR